MPKPITKHKLANKLNDAVVKLDVEAVKLLVKEPAARSVIDEWALLGCPLETFSETPVREKRLAVYGLLQSTGASPNGSGDPRSVYLPLVSAIRADLDLEQRKQLVTDLLDRGADPNAAVHWGTAFAVGNLSDDRWFADEFLRRGKILPATFNDALRLAIERKNAAAIERALPLCSDPGGPSVRGLPPLHYAAMAGDDAIFASVLAAAPDLNAPLNQSIEVPLMEAAPPRGGSVPTIMTAPGNTVLDLLEQVAAQVRPLAESYEKQDSEAQRQSRLSFIERLSGRIERLKAAGAMRGTLAESGRG